MFGGDEPVCSDAGGDVGTQARTTAREVINRIEGDGLGLVAEGVIESRKIAGDHKAPVVDGKSVSGFGREMLRKVVGGAPTGGTTGDEFFGARSLIHTAKKAHAAERVEFKDVGIRFDNGDWGGWLWRCLLRPGKRSADEHAQKEKARRQHEAGYRTSSLEQGLIGHQP